MNSQATPINQVKEESSNLVNDILNELNQSEEVEVVKPKVKKQSTPIAASEFNPPVGSAPVGSLSMANQGNMNNATLNYQMDPNIQPIPPIAGPPRPGMPTMLTPEQAAAYAAAQAQAQNNGLESMLKTVMSEIREPLLVALLFVILNQHIIHRLIIKYVPFLSNGDKLSTFGIILLGLLGGVLFYFLKIMNISG